MRKRVRLWELPNIPTRCLFARPCPYRSPPSSDNVGACDNPRLNRQNSDALCFFKANGDILSALDIKEGATWPTR